MSEEKRKRGRPNKPDSEKIAKRPKMAVYLPKELKAKLHNAAAVLHKPAYLVVETALEEYLSSLPKADREAIEILAARRAAHDKERLSA